MKKHRIEHIGGIVSLLILAFFLGSAGPLWGGETATATPTELNIAIITSTIIEEPWNTALIQAFERVKPLKPHGLCIKYDIVEKVPIPDAGRILSQLAKSGKYQVIWAHSTYADAIKTIRTHYPDLLWAYSGGGNYPLGETLIGWISSSMSRLTFWGY